MDSEKYIEKRTDATDIYLRNAVEEIDGVYWPALVPVMDKEISCSKTLFLLDSEVKVEDPNALGFDLQRTGCLEERFFADFLDNGEKQKGGLFLRNLEMTPIVMYQMMALEKRDFVTRYMCFGVQYLDYSAREGFWNYVREFTAVLCQKGFSDCAKKYFTNVIEMAHSVGIIPDEGMICYLKIQDCGIYRLVKK